MSRGILGRKVGMTEIFDEGGNVVPVTVLQAGPCHVLQLRTKERDGYVAVQLGFGEKPRTKARRSERGHVARLSSRRAKRRAVGGLAPIPKANCEPPRYIRELRGPTDGYQVGQEVRVDVLADVKAVDVTGVTKGRGFAGPIKRHHFSGQRATHGVKKVHRHAGGTGSSAYPSRVFKGKRMAGHYGHTRVTTRNLHVVSIDAQHHLLVVRGAVPGPNGGFVTIRETNKVQ